MLLVVQHPLADFREFLGASGRLGRPTWPLPSLNKDFIRSFGQVRARLRGGIAEWAGEEAYCIARGAIRFPDQLRAISLGSGAFSVTAQRTFRRFHSDGMVSRAEIGLGLRGADLPVTPATSADLLKLIHDCAQLPVKVKGADGQLQDSKLVSCAGALARNYLRATTNRKAGGDLQPWWISQGDPALLVEGADPATLPLTPYARRVLDVNGIRVFHDWLQFGPHKCSTWFIGPTKSSSDALRRLRIHLMRLHAERECLRLTLTMFARGKLPLDGAKVPALVQEYLNDAIRALQKSERFGLPQSEMFDAALSAVDIATEGQYASLEKMRRQVFVKLQDYLKKTEASSNVTVVVQGDYVSSKISMGNVSVEGDFNVVTAKNITNSFNKAASAEVNDDLKERLKELNIAVAKLAAQLPAEKAEEVSKDIQALTAEATSKEPRRKWYELSADGLVEAAKAVKDMAAPIATAVGAVLALLA